MIQIDDKTFGDVIRAISTSNKILAIKIVGKCLDMNLKDSKEYVEALSIDIRKPREVQGTYLVGDEYGRTIRKEIKWDASETKTKWEK